jgi:putative serine protease PepD
MTTPNTEGEQRSPHDPRATDSGRATSAPGRWALAMLASAVLAAAAVVAVLFATDAVHTGGTTVSAAAPPTSGATVGGGSLHPAGLYADVASGVVDITARGTTRVASPFGSTREPSTSTGSGIVVDRRGDILTADHVVRGASSISIAFADGATRSARVLGHDATTDVAVLAVKPPVPSLHPLALGDSGALQVGDPVAAIGDPFGYQRSMSTGIVSGLDRTIQGLNGFSVGHAVQTDAAIDPGNSGGPLLNARGQVIGIVDQIATGSSGADSSTGVGFAVSSNVAKAELGALEHGSAPAHAYLGVGTAPAIDLGGGRGVVVVTVQRASPAAKAGVRAGDIIDAVDGRPLRGVNDLTATVSARRPGQAMTLAVRRHGRRLTLHVVLAAQPRAASAG